MLFRSCYEELDGRVFKSRQALFLVDLLSYYLSRAGPTSHHGECGSHWPGRRVPHVSLAGSTVCGPHMSMQWWVPHVMSGVGPICQFGGPHVSYLWWVPHVMLAVGPNCYCIVYSQWVNVLVPPVSDRFKLTHGHDT